MIEFMHLGSMSSPIVRRNDDAEKHTSNETNVSVSECQADGAAHPSPRKSILAQRTEH